MTGGGDDLTGHLRDWHAGDEGAFDGLLPRVYERLRRIARARLRAEREDHTLDTSALVHEAYLRMRGESVPEWQDRDHFFAVASTAMRHILVDHARRRSADKRGGLAERVPIARAMHELASGALTAPPDLMLELDDALTRLAVLRPRHAKAVELRYFAGLTLEEVAAVLGTSAPTVLRDLRYALAWLARDFE